MAAGRSAAHQAARHRDKAAEHRRKAEWHERQAADLLPEQTAAAPAAGAGPEPHPAGTHRRRRRGSVTLPRPSRRAVRLLGLAAVAVVVLLYVPFAAHQLTDVLTGDEPTAAAAAPTVAAPAVYRDCAALRAAYPNGVKATGAANAGRKARPVSAVDTALATANGRLDDDGDGLVCERRRPKHQASKH
jgi:hypothetical protein